MNSDNKSALISRPPMPIYPHSFITPVVKPRKNFNLLPPMKIEYEKVMYFIKINGNTTTRPDRPHYREILHEQKRGLASIITITELESCDTTSRL